MAEIKKTMVDALAFVTEHGNMSKENLDLFTSKFCVKASGGNGTSKPRIATKLFSADGQLLGGRCSATGLWFKLEDFNPHHGLSKQAQNVKARNNTAAKEVETNANSILSEARELVNPEDKLEAFERYDDEISKAKSIRETVITPEDFTVEVETFATVEDLAAELGVEVITTKPKVEEEVEEVEA